MRLQFRAVLAQLAAGVLSLLLFASGSSAADAASGTGHKARLSADLQDHLDHNSQSLEAIVHGDRAACDALARTYGLVVRRYLANEGCLFRLTAGQLAALQQDETQDHISGNTRLKSADDVTAQAIGADQVWAGYDDLPASDGTGIT